MTAGTHWWLTHWYLERIKLYYCCLVRFICLYEVPRSTIVQYVLSHHYVITTHRTAASRRARLRPRRRRSISSGALSTGLIPTFASFRRGRYEAMSKFHFIIKYKILIVLSKKSERLIKERSLSASRLAPMVWWSDRVQGGAPRKLSAIRIAR